MAAEGTSFVLLAVDTAGIQSYVFGSNRLKDNIGASYLVKQATEDWAFEALNIAAPSNNLQDNKQIELHGLDAEVLYAGGGNFIVLFSTPKAAKTFTRELSIRALIEAPGLRLDIYQEVFEWTGTELGAAVKQLLINMKIARGKKNATAPLMGVGVTAMCQSTALPAVVMDGDDPISAAVFSKRNAADAANKWLRRELPPGKPDNGYEYPFDLDDLGRSAGERSYIAVVHADGNGMGQLIRDIGTETNNRRYIERMREFSETVKVISKAAMQSVIDLLKKKTLEDTKIGGTRTVSDLEFGWNDKTKRLILPIRPLVFGGDDTTFVCDGRLGLSLASAYLHAFEDQSRKWGLNLSACAGIAVVKSHYPFARAYQLAEELCDEAKKFRREVFKDGGGALDWYFTSGGLYDDLEAMREREYTTSEGSLTLRPVSLGNEGRVRSWDEIERLTTTFQTDWADMRNKAKAFRDALREGPEAVKRFKTIYIDKKQADDLDTQIIPKLPGYEETGWNEGICGYFDALELMDIHIPLQQESVTP